MSLENFDYEFTEGLNTIKQENGFGKTTFASFIKAMFYGLEAKRNTKALIDRKKYEPWQGGSFGGNIEFEIDGKKYKVERFFGKKKKYKVERFFGKKEADDTFKIYDLSTNLETNDFSENLGEEIFKLNKEAYERSTFISGQNMETSMNDSINAKLGNILENENDINSSEKAIKTVDDAIKFYKKTGGRGEINEAILKKSKLEQKLENSKTDEKNLQERKKSLETLKKQISEKLVQQEKYRKNIIEINEEEAKKSKLEQYTLLKNQVDESQKKLKEFLDKGTDDLELTNKIEFNKNKLENTKKQIERNNNKLKFNKKICIVNLIISIIIAIITIILYIKNLKFIGIILAVICLISAISFIILSVVVAKTKGKLDTKNQEKENLDNMLNTLNSIYEKQKKEIEEESNRLKQEYDIKLKNLEAFEKLNNIQELISYAPKTTNLNKAEIEKNLNSLNKEINKLNDEKNYIQNQIELLEASVDTFEIENELNETTDKIEEMKHNLDILEKTKDYLSMAKEQFSSHYLKGMQESFVKNIEFLNGKKIDINLDVNLNAEINEKGSNKKIDFFSTGYQDIIYICMRLSLIESLFEKEKPFIILDDPFVNLDEEKIQHAKELINNISKQYQIIYFACHESIIKSQVSKMIYKIRIIIKI